MLIFFVLGVIFLAGISIIWTTLWVGISPMPSSRRAILVMLEEIDIDAWGADPIVDVGSGWGSLVFAASAKFQERQIIGYEVSWVPWLFSKIRQFILRRNNLCLLRRDFLQIELPASAVIVCYLFPRGMRQLEEKLKQKQACAHRLLVISNTFALPSSTPVKVIKLNDLYRSPVYVYHFEAMSPPCRGLG